MEPLSATPQIAVDAGERPKAPIWLKLSLPIALLAMTGSVIAILFDDTIYRNETANWAAQAVGQDIANLLIFPALLVLAFFASRGSLRALLGWIGALVYCVYTYVIYVFDISFGPLFLLWVAVFGMSIFALIGGLGSLDPVEAKSGFGPRAPTRMAGSLLLAVGGAFYLLWLSEIVPALIDGTRPDALAEVGVPTNPVHVLDLSMFLPAAILAGLLLLKGRPWGFVLGPVLLVAMACIGLGIVSLTAVVAARGLEGTPAIGIGVAALVSFELLVVVRFLGASRDQPAPPVSSLLPLRIRRRSA